MKQPRRQPTLAPQVDNAVEAALARGKATLPQFVAALKNPNSNQSVFSVYAVVREGALAVELNRSARHNGQLYVGAPRIFK